MKKILVITLAIFAVLSFGFGSLSCQPGYSGEPESITIGIPPNEQSGLIFIAEELKFFEKNGLKATIKVYDTALAALDGMEKGEVDVSQSAELPIVTEAFKNKSISVIGSIDRFENIFLVGRKSRGLANVSDLKGKRVGVARGTLTEFFLGRFLSLNRINLEDVTIVNMRFTESADALANGTVDAFQVQNKDIPKIKEKLGNDLVIWASQSKQTGFEVISGRRDWITSHTESTTRLLKALVEAENYYANNADEARAIIQKKLNYDDAYMATVTASQHTYSLSLDQSLILAMEDEARWMISNNLTTEKTIPNFLNYFYTDGLKSVKPGAVRIAGK